MGKQARKSNFVKTLVSNYTPQGCKERNNKKFKAIMIRKSKSKITICQCRFLRRMMNC